MRTLTINEIQAVSGGLHDGFYESARRALLVMGAGVALIQLGYAEMQAGQIDLIGFGFVVVGLFLAVTGGAGCAVLATAFIP